MKSVTEGRQFELHPLLLGVRWRRFSGCVHNVHYVDVADSVGFA